MKKRLPGLILLFVLLTLLLSTAALAADIELNQTYVEENTAIKLNRDCVILQGGNTYSLAGDLTLDGKFLYVTPSSDQADFNVTLDLKGNTLTIQNPVSLNDPNFGVTYYSDYQGSTRKEASPIGILVYTTYNEHADQLPLTLTLTDSSEAKTGKLDVQSADATGIYVGRNCTLNIAGGTITNSTTVRDETYNAAGVMTVLGTVNLTGGRIENQSIGVLLRGGTFSMSGDAEIANCGYLDENGKPQGGGGVYADTGYKEATDTTGTNGYNSHSSALTMSGGTIKNCMNVVGGGGVCLDGGTFTMSGGTITGCKTAGSSVSTVNTSTGGGGVYAGGTFTMSGGMISNCAVVSDSASGGGVYVNGTFNMSGDAKITGCTALAGGGVRAYKANSYDTTAFTMSDSASITNCEALGAHGGGVDIYYSDFTMEDTASITGCTATDVSGDVKDGDCLFITRSAAALSVADSVTIGGQISQYFVDDRINGLGTAKYPYQLGNKKELVLFGSIVNGTVGDHIPAQRDACAVLTDDIDLENENWTPIGNASDYDDTNAYSGTFDGGRHTISGLSVSGNLKYAGLFGYTNGAAIRNLTVSGSVTSTDDYGKVGGVVGYADGCTIEYCGNLCTVNGNSAGGIAGKTYSTTISACYNAGGITGAEHGGGIAGYFARNGSIYDCYNVGTIGSTVYAGGIMGIAEETLPCNCYNAGTVTGRYISGIGSSALSINSYYLKGTAVDRFATEQSAEEFAGGTVLEKLKTIRADVSGNPLPVGDPWADECKYLAAVGRTLPVFKWQTGDTHTHQSNTWETSETEHWQVCACGAVFDKAEHHGGTATCKAKATCTVCGHEYGELGAHDFTAEKAEEKYLKSAATCTEQAAYYKSCAICGLSSKGTDGEATFASGNVLGHDWGKWQSDGNGTHTRICSRDPSHKETEDCSGGTANCHEKAICEVCGQAYGAFDPSNHDGGTELKNKKDPTCTKKGYTGDTYCKGCGEKLYGGKEIPATGKFDDVPAGSYYEEAVIWAARAGITDGTDTCLFSPNDICTRAQAVTFLWRAAGSPAPKSGTMPFADVPKDSYYYDAVLWAVENGITKGTGETTFSPDLTCTRAQIVTFLWRSEQSPAAEGSNPFADVSSSEYYAEAVQWAVENGITKGTGETTFSPNDGAARAHIVTFVWRCKVGD